MKPFLRRATDADFWRFYGRRAPAWWVGIVAEDEHMLLGIGGVFAGDDGRIWCAFDRCRGVRAPMLMQKAARVLLASLKDAGVREAFALADPRVSRSDFWLSRLGFEVTDEMQEQLAVWKWTPSH